MHLITFHKAIEEFNPQVFIVDPISNLSAAGTAAEVKSILTRLIDYLKTKQIATFLTDLTHFGGSLEHTSEEVSSLIDTWLLLRDIELNGERNRGISILKSRGMAHSNQIHEFLLTNQGIGLIDIYTGSGDVLTGSARAVQQAEEKAFELARRLAADGSLRVQEHKREALEAKIAALRAEFDAESEELHLMAEGERKRQAVLAEDRLEMAHLRKGEPSAARRSARKRRGKESKVKAVSPGKRKKAKTDSTEEIWNLRLYVAGQTPKSITAFANLKKICEEHSCGEIPH